VVLNLRKQQRDEDVEKGIVTIRGKGMATMKASKCFTVPHTMMQALENKSTLPLKQIAATKLGYRTVLGDLIEEELVKHILMEEKFYGLT